MSEKSRSRDIRRQIRRVLLERWDPIGVGEVPEAQDEYDGYIGGVHQLLVAGGSVDAIVDHLFGIERDRMELPCRDKKLLASVATALLDIDVRP